MWSRVMFPLVMLLWVLPAVADAQSFGRLFTTPAERVALDRARDALCLSGQPGLCPRCGA